MTPRQDALDLLKGERLEVTGLFEAFESLCRRKASDIEKSAVIERIILVLNIRAQIEDELFHPAVRSANIDLVALGAQMHRRKSALMAQHKALLGRSEREDESADPVGRPSKG
jgi:hypothetical protein